MVSEPDFASEFSLRAERHGRAAVVRARGRVDFTTTPAFHEALAAEVAARPSALIVDLSGLDLITSAGLRALMQTKKALAGTGGALIVTGVAGTVADVFRVSRFDALLTIRTTVEEALASIPPDAGEV
jgi:anti-anti-sigma factor